MRRQLVVSCLTLLVAGCVGLPDHRAGPDTADDGHVRWELSLARLIVDNGSDLRLAGDYQWLASPDATVDAPNRTITLAKTPTSRYSAGLEYHDLSNGSSALLLVGSSLDVQRGDDTDEHTAASPVGRFMEIRVGPVGVEVDGLYFGACPRLIKDERGDDVWKGEALFGGHLVNNSGALFMTFRGYPNSGCEPGTIVIEASGSWTAVSLDSKF